MLAAGEDLPDRMCAFLRYLLICVLRFIIVRSWSMPWIIASRLRLIFGIHSNCRNFYRCSRNVHPFENRHFSHYDFAKPFLASVLTSLVPFFPIASLYLINPLQLVPFHCYSFNFLGTGEKIWTLRIDRLSLTLRHITIGILKFCDVSHFTVETFRKMVASRFLDLNKHTCDPLPDPTLYQFVSILRI